MKTCFAKVGVEELKLVCTRPWPQPHWTFFGMSWKVYGDPAFLPAITDALVAINPVECFPSWSGGYYNSKTVTKSVMEMECSSSTYQCDGPWHSVTASNLTSIHIFPKNCNDLLWHINLQAVKHMSHTIWATLCFRCNKVQFPHITGRRQHISSAVKKPAYVLLLISAQSEPSSVPDNKATNQPNYLRKWLREPR